MIARRIAIQKSKIFVAEVLDAIEYIKIQAAIITSPNIRVAIGRKMYLKIKSFAVIPSSIHIKRKPKIGMVHTDTKMICRPKSPFV